MNRTALLAVVLSLLALPGCNVVERMTGETARKEAQAAEVKERTQKTQLGVMRYADQFLDRVVRSTNELLQEAPNRDDHVAILEWQFSQATAAVQVAAGPNPMVNAADMVVMVSLGRRLIERDWVAHYGEAARPLLQAYESEEKEAWQLLSGLTEQQRAELSLLLDEWVKENPDERNASFVRFGEFGVTGAKKAKRASPGLLSSIRIDPLAGLDPAVREVEQTRLLAERAVYYAQRVPRLLDIQGQLIMARTRQSGEMEQVMGTVEGVGQLSQSLTRLADEAPALVAREREAAIQQLMRELQRQQRDMLALSTELRTAIEAGDVTAKSLEQMIQATDRLVSRFQREPSDTRPRARPFDITEYTRAITELASTTRELQALVRGVDGATPGLARQVEALATRVQGLVDYAFWRLLMLIAAVLLAAIAYQLVVRRIRS